MPDCYIYVAEIDGVVRYVGRGRGRRMREHMWNVARGTWRSQQIFYAKLTDAVKRGAEIRFYKVMENLSPEVAPALEQAEIMKYPRSQLWNVVPARRPKLTDEESRARMSAASRAMWADPKFRAKMMAIRADATYRARLAISSQRRSKDPGWLAKNAVARAKADARDPEAHSAATKRAMADPALRARLSAKAQSRWQESREKNLAQLEEARRRKAMTPRQSCDHCYLRHRKCTHIIGGDNGP